MMQYGGAFALLQNMGKGPSSEKSHSSQVNTCPHRPPPTLPKLLHPTCAVCLCILHVLCVSAPCLCCVSLHFRYAVYLCPLLVLSVPALWLCYVSLHFGCAVCLCTLILLCVAAPYLCCVSLHLGCAISNKSKSLQGEKMALEKPTAHAPAFPSLTFPENKVQRMSIKISLCE